MRQGRSSGYVASPIFLSIYFPLETSTYKPRTHQKIPDIKSLLPPHYSTSPLHSLTFYFPLNLLPPWFSDVFVNTRQQNSTPNQPALDRDLATGAASKLFGAIFGTADNASGSVPRDVPAPQDADGAEEETKQRNGNRSGDGSEKKDSREKRLQMKFFYRQSIYWEKWHVVSVKGRAGSEVGVEVKEGLQVVE